MARMKQHLDEEVEEEEEEEEAKVWEATHAFLQCTKEEVQRLRAEIILLRAGHDSLACSHRKDLEGLCKALWKSAGSAAPPMSESKKRSKEGLAQCIEALRRERDEARKECTRLRGSDQAARVLRKELDLSFEALRRGEDAEARVRKEADELRHEVTVARLEASAMREARSKDVAELQRVRVAARDGLQSFKALQSTAQSESVALKDRMDELSTDCAKRVAASVKTASALQQERLENESLRRQLDDAKVAAKQAKKETLRTARRLEDTQFELSKIQNHHKLLDRVSLAVRELREPPIY